LTYADSPSLEEKGRVDRLNILKKGEKKMTVNEVKKRLMAWPGVEIEGKPKAKTVDFTDLMRCKQTFIEIWFAKRPDSEEVVRMETFCKENGFILSNNQVWFERED